MCPHALPAHTRDWHTARMEVCCSRALAHCLAGCPPNRMQAARACISLFFPPFLHPPGQAPWQAVDVCSTRQQDAQVGRCKADQVARPVTINAVCMPVQQMRDAWLLPASLLCEPRSAKILGQRTAARCSSGSTGRC